MHFEALIEYSVNGFFKKLCFLPNTLFKLQDTEVLSISIDGCDKPFLKINGLHGTHQTNTNGAIVRECINRTQYLSRAKKI